MKSKEAILKDQKEKRQGKLSAIYWETTIFDAMEEYAQQFKDGPQWIKASERLPETFKNVYVKTNYKKGYVMCIDKSGVWDECPIQYADEQIIEWLDESGQRTPADDENDPFIEKHLKIIMNKTLDIMIVSHIERMWGGLEMASVQHFVETGKVNGSLYLRIKELAMGFAERWHNTAKSTPADDAVEEKFGEWQLCPKCNGSGEIFSHDTTNIYKTCDVCIGAKIIAKPIVETL